MKLVITVVGKDQVGIIAKVSNILADNDVNILDISQTILQDKFIRAVFLCKISASKVQSGINSVFNLVDAVFSA